MEDPQIRIQKILTLLGLDSLSDEALQALQNTVAYSSTNFDELVQDVIDSEHLGEGVYCPRMQMEITVPCQLAKCEYYKETLAFHCRLGAETDEVTDEDKLISFSEIATMLNCEEAEVKTIYSAAVRKLKQASLDVDYEIEFSGYQPKYTYLKLKDRCWACGDKTELRQLRTGLACKHCITTATRPVLELEFRYRTNINELLIATTKYDTMKTQSLALGVCPVTLFKLYDRCKLDRRVLFKKFRKVRTALVNRPGRKLPTRETTGFLYRYYLASNFNLPQTPLSHNLTTSFVQKANTIVEISKLKLMDTNVVCDKDAFLD